MAYTCGLSNVLKLKGAVPPFTLVATLKHWTVPVSFKDVELPELRKLPVLDKVPTWTSLTKPIKMEKRLIDIRGPELVHNRLIYKQYGIITLCGIYLKSGHIHMIRSIINREMDAKRSFAVWRIDAPWKAITRKGQGKRMGGGKGSISYYVTPVRAGRIIVEVAGAVEYEEVFPYLNKVVERLPCDAMVISEEIMQNLKKEEEMLEEANSNPFTFEYVVKNRMHGCQSWISNYDTEWFGKYV